MTLAPAVEVIIVGGPLTGVGAVGCSRITPAMITSVPRWR